MELKMLKRKIIINLGIAWVVLLGLWGLIYLEGVVTEPVTRITNALWVVGMIIVVVLMVRGFYYLSKYIKVERGSRR